MCSESNPGIYFYETLSRSHYEQAAFWTDGCKGRYLFIMLRVYLLCCDSPSLEPYLFNSIVLHFIILYFVVFLLSIIASPLSDDR